MFKTASGKRSLVILCAMWCFSLLNPEFPASPFFKSGNRPILIVFFVVSLVLLYASFRSFRKQSRIEKLEEKRADSLNNGVQLAVRVGKAGGYQAIPAVVLGGSGFTQAKESTIVITCKGDCLSLLSFEPKRSEQLVRFEEIVSLDITGPGTQRTSAKLVGGGFGAEGMLKGILVASAINSLTAKYKTNTFLRLSTRTGEIHFHITTLEPSDLRMILSPAFVQMEAMKIRPLASGAGAVSEEITKLHEMFEKGMLTSDEFASAKKRVIGR